MRHHIQGDKGVEEGDERMKDLTLGPHAPRRRWLQAQETRTAPTGNS